MKVTVLGCSPAWPNPGGAHSGYLLEASGALLLDLGPGVLARLRSDGGWPEPDAVVLSHFHLDHCGDLVPWVWGYHHLVRAGHPPRQPILAVPPGGRAFLQRIGTLFGEAEMFDGPFVVEEYGADRPFELAGFTLSATRVPHYDADAFALRVECEGTTVVYSGDTAPCDGIAALARNADLLICEATLADGAADAELRGHLSLAEAEAIFERSGARRLLVTHRPSDLPAPEQHELARDGLVIELR